MKNEPKTSKLIKVEIKDNEIKKNEIEKNDIKKYEIDKNDIKKNEIIKDEIRKMILGLGADVCGIADMERFEGAPKGFHPGDIYKDCRSVIVAGIALPRGIMEVEPRLIYGHFNYQATVHVDTVTFRAAKEIEKCYGKIAVPIPADSPYEYWDQERMEGKGLISMKHAAVAAGLGTLGKSSLFLNKIYGTLLTLGAIFTNMELEADILSDPVCIEGCSLCIKNCPVQALDGTTAVQKKCRMNSYGKTDRGFDTVDCNKCRKVCPRCYGISK